MCLVWIQLAYSKHYTYNSKINAFRDYMYCRGCLYSNSEHWENILVYHNPFGKFSGWEGDLKTYMNQKKKRSDETMKMREKLEKLQELGAEIFVDGEKLSPQDTADMVVCEDQHYMADYVLGEAGNVEQVRFDWVDL